MRRPRRYQGKGWIRLVGTRPTNYLSLVDSIKQISLWLKFLLQDFLPLPDVLQVTFSLEGLNSVIKRDESAATDLRNEEDDLQDLGQSGVKFVLGVVRIKLGEDKLDPEFADDGLGEVVVLEQVNLISHLRPFELAVGFFEFLFDLAVFLFQGSHHEGTVLGLHKTDDVFVADFAVLDHEGALHGVLLQVPHDLHPLQVVLLQQQKMQGLPLLHVVMEGMTFLQKHVDLLDDLQVL